MTAELHYASA